MYLYAALALPLSQHKILISDLLDRIYYNLTHATCIDNWKQFKYYL